VAAVGHNNEFGHLRLRKVQVIKRIGRVGRKFVPFSIRCSVVRTKQTFRELCWGPQTRRTPGARRATSHNPAAQPGRTKIRPNALALRRWWRVRVIGVRRSATNGMVAGFDLVSGISLLSRNGLLRHVRMQVNLFPSSAAQCQSG
jgi:hypothetical protein